MIYESLGAQALDYTPCRYPGSRILFRGPCRRTEGRYIAFLGGSETYGRFVERPFPVLVEAATGLPAVNLGCVNAGIDVYLAEPALLDIASRAECTVIQITGAQNLSNRFYSVHPRRNDRFLGASRLLGKIYPGIDFTEMHFTRHLLAALQDESDQKFDLVRDELRQAWVARMRNLIRRVGGRVVLLWLSARRPESAADLPRSGDEPLLVTREMLDALGDLAELVEVVVTQAELRKGRAALRCGAAERPAADSMLGTLAHVRAAAALLPMLEKP